MMSLWTALAACAVWAVWNPTILEWTQRWSEDPTYSHGFLVPLFSVGLLWWKRREISAITPRPTWWGVVVMAIAAGVHFSGSYYYIRWLQGAGLLLYLAGISLVVGGWQLLKQTWAATGFLVFMIPLPFRLEDSMRQPLMQMATVASTFLLQLVGLPAIAHGNIIDINEHQLGVAEACSGLKMLITFFALATGLVLIIKRPLLDKVVIMLSAVPIAIISNVVRITATGILYETMGPKTAEFVYHDLAGYLMMPLGIGLMWLLMKTLECLFVERKAYDPSSLRPVLLGTDLGLIPQRSKPKQKPRSLEDF